ncbi:Flp family type IVb pilin [Vibrio renipiscarius]|uniref:Fimbrial protein n=1 Tax=Vibrio renipiscarius TaxID=1461322 RepID=A0A0C2NHW5_9VIBR|nr:Flp family type IVb pilin [Vibrio renipiscarius]KII76017.1 fimbrial protein [Vibrio renipiscarius]KII79121.1 fimbrial protein [Vibrio renipiscarius]
MLAKMYVKTKLFTEGLINDRRGVTAIEYAIIGVAISAIVLAVFSSDAGIKKALTDAVALISGNITAADAIK